MDCSSVPKVRKIILRCKKNPTKSWKSNRKNRWR